MKNSDTLRPVISGRKALAMLIGLAAHVPANAVLLNEMQATASQNTILTIDNVVPVSATTAVTAAVNLPGGDASASTRITLLQVSATSRDVQSFGLSGNAAQYSSFTFWNTDTDSPYAVGSLAGTSLILDYTLQGAATMPAEGNARSTSFTYDTQLYIGVGFNQVAGGASLSCGPVGPCIPNGSPLLTTGTNNVLENFSLTSGITAGNGLLFSSLSTGDGGGASSAFFLALTGLRHSGTSPLPLGLRFNDGTVLSVTPVPVPGAAGLMLAALGLLGVRLRTQRIAS
jgi:hypothetical protein